MLETSRLIPAKDITWRKTHSVQLQYIAKTINVFRNTQKFCSFLLSLVTLDYLLIIV